MKILLADDHALFRDGMHYVLQQLSGKVEVHDAATFQEAEALADRLPDLELALLDLNMPGSSGAPSIKSLHQKHSQLPIVVISGSEQREDIERVMESGALGYISKMSPAKIMLGALRLVLDGGIYLPPQLLQQSAIIGGKQDKVDKRSANTNEHGLTQRQMEALRYLAEGRTNKEISEIMGLADGTIKIHIAAVYQVLRVNSRLEAVLAAEKLGLVAPRVSQ
ncbi:MAG: response regulator transcription factor [Nitrosomonadales bacterium]|nr:response regulator transcription factor [Nitrosomonadales bacterium]